MMKTPLCRVKLFLPEETLVLVLHWENDMDHQHVNTETSLLPCAGGGFAILEPECVD